MAVRSRRFFGPTTVAAGTNVVLYTVPADRTARFSLVTVVSQGTGTGIWTLRVNSAVAQAIFSETHAAAEEAWQILDGLVLNPGDTLEASAPTGVNLRVAGYGSLLFGAPA